MKPFASEIGQLDQRITFERFTETPDGAGGVTRTWAPIPHVPTVWAHVKARLGREGMEQGRVSDTQISTFTVRYRSDVSEVDRVIWRGEAWNIRRIMRSSQRELYLAIDAERGVQQ